jgi:bifunctional DNA-binding transcriptional regulator/antitoxin component of YhaV-PrlF toxin-antitoxin module
MPLHVVMDEKGVISFPPELIERLGWQADMDLKLTITPTGDLAIEPANNPRRDSNGEQDIRAR